MSQALLPEAPALARPHAAPAGGAVMIVLLAISFGHLVNDLLQSLVPAIYPVLKARFGLSFSQVGGIALVNQLTASVLQPGVGHFTDRRPLPYSLPLGMCSTLCGLLLLARAPSYLALLGAVALVGVGSSVFHPESSRVARLASGGRHGMAQSVFQVGGNVGSALGPLLAAYVVAPYGNTARGQAAVAWFGLAAMAGIGVLAGVGGWYRRRLLLRVRKPVGAVAGGRVGGAMAILVVLMISKFFYMASIANYYTFYLIGRFHLDTHMAQLCLFLFMGAFAVGTLAGGPIGDRIGRKQIIWTSILGVLPFTLALPYAGLTVTVLLTIPIGLLLASAFPAIVVYAQELMPGRVGTVSGMMFGLAFGLGGLGAAGLGVLADHTSVALVFQLCAFLPALGVLAGFLPRIPRVKEGNVLF